MNRRLILVIALPLLLVAGYFIAGFLWQEHDATTPPPPPQPTSTSASVDPLAEYKKIPPASCPPSIDPNLRRYFYREGQCPTSKGAKE